MIHKNLNYAQINALFQAKNNNNNNNQEDIK